MQDDAETSFPASSAAACLAVDASGSSMPLIVRSCPVQQEDEMLGALEQVWPVAFSQQAVFFSGAW